MGETRGQEPTAQEQLEDAIAQIEQFSSESVTYDQLTLMRSYNDATRFADLGVESKEFKRPKAVEIKLEVTRRIREIATVHGDSVVEDMMAQAESTYEALLKALKLPKKAKPRKPASTSKTKTGAAKSPTPK